MTDSFRVEFDAMLRRANEAKAKVMFDRMPKLARGWDDLFNYEKDSIIKLLIEADNAWWAVVYEFNERVKLTHDTREETNENYAGKHRKPGS